MLIIMNRFFRLMLKTWDPYNIFKYKFYVGFVHK